MEPATEMTPRTTRQMPDVSTTWAILVVGFDLRRSRIAITRARSANNAAQKNDRPAANPVPSNPKRKTLKRPTPIMTKAKMKVDAADKAESVRARVNMKNPFEDCTRIRSQFVGRIGAKRVRATRGRRHPPQSSFANDRGRGANSGGGLRPSSRASGVRPAPAPIDYRPSLRLKCRG